MSYPHWGREDVIAGLIEEVRAAAGLLIEVVAPPEAGGARFVDAIADGVDGNGVAVVRISANERTRLHPGALAADLGAIDGRTVLIIEQAHLADSRSLAAIATRLASDPELTILVERQPVEGAAERPFLQLAAIAAQAGGHRQVALSAPSVEEVAKALDLERDAALALHKAAGGRDGRLVALLDDLGAGDRGPQELAQVLAGLAEQAAPLRGLSEQAQHIAELTAVALEPLTSDVVAAAIGAPERDVLVAIESLVDAGVAQDAAGGLIAADTRLAQSVADSLSASRIRAAHRALAAALAGRPGLEYATAHHSERAGDWQQAFDRWAAVADSARATDSTVADVAVERALTVLAQGATTDPQHHGRLLLARAQALSSAAYSDLALADLRAAAPLLTGEERIDALGFLAAVLDNQQLPQEAEVVIATAEWEARSLGAQHKLGSLLTFRARTAARLGFADEADHVLERGLELIAQHGTARQQRNARTNRAWMAFDRGEAARAEQLFDELTGDDAEPADLAEVAWHGRALALRSLAGRARDEFDRVDLQGDDPTATVGQFLAAIGRQELAMRMGRPEAALAANATERALVTLFLPAWENGTWHRKAEALFAGGDFDGAADAASRALDTTPGGSNGQRWRLRTDALMMKIEHRRSGAWDKAAAENLTDVLLHSGWYGAAAELMVTRAGIDEDAALANDAADLALRLGDPMVAAAALAAGGDASRQAVGRAVQAVSDDVPADWRAAWEAQPGIAQALSVEVIDEAAEPDWHADLRSWLDESDLAERRLSPAQRRTGGLVRRSPEPRRFGLVALASTMAAAVATVLVMGALGIPPFAPPTTTSAPTTTATVATTDATTTTTLPPIEERMIEAPETLAGQFAFRGGNTRSGVVESSGVVEPLGYYYRDDTANPVRSSPSIRGDNAYIGGEDGDVHIINFRSGIELTIAMSDAVAAPVVVAEIELGGVDSSNKQAIIYAADRRGRVVALGTDTSEFNRLELGSDITAAPIVTEEAVLIATADGRILAYRHDLGGEPVWVFPRAEDEALPAGFVFTPALSDGLLYAGSESGIVYAIDVATGVADCTYDAGVRVSAGPAIAEGRVWIPAGTAVHVLEAGSCAPARTGQIQVQIGAPAVVTPVVFGERIFVASNRLMIALDLTATGADSGEIWSQPTDGLVRSSPVLANGTLYFGSDDGKVYAVDAESGDLLWTFDTGGPVQSSVAVIDGLVLATNNDGRIVAIAGTP